MHNYVLLRPGRRQRIIRARLVALCASRSAVIEPRKVSSLRCKQALRDIRDETNIRCRPHASHSPKPTGPRKPFHNGPNRACPIFTLPWSSVCVSNAQCLSISGCRDGKQDYTPRMHTREQRTRGGLTVEIEFLRICEK